MPKPLISLIFLFFLGSCARQNFYQHEALYQNDNPASLSQPNNNYVWVTVGKHYQRNALHELIWGKHYRDVWAVPVQVPVLNLTKVKGGLVPSEMGGGLQTTSLALLNPEGRTFTLRTLDKDPSKSLSPFLRKTFVSNLMRDQTSALNPFAPFTLPPMAGAANIFHTHPEIYYVPENTTGLGKHQESFGGKVVMLEEKYENKQALTPAFGGANDLINTQTLRERKNNSNLHHIDQLAFARARLFDVFISDIDRHEGQWNWAEYFGGQGDVVYKPVPKDRDYAYYQFADGLIPWLLTRRILVGHIKPFIHNIPDVAGIIYKARELDEEFLNEVTAIKWAQAAQELQAALTDSVIKKAMAAFPEPVYKISGKYIEKKLKKRVTQLPQLAAEYYNLLAKDVKVSGSGKKERFMVQQLADKSVKVEVFTLPDIYQETPKCLYQRIFKYPETKRITLNGLGGNDEYSMDDSLKKNSKIIINWSANEKKAK